MDQTDGQGQGEITALGLVEQASREASANGMQLHLRDGALAAKKKPPVRGARIVNAVAIADEGLAIAAQIQQRIPIRAVPAETGHFGREHDADLAQCHTVAVSMNFGPLVLTNSGPPSGVQSAEP